MAGVGVVEAGFGVESVAGVAEGEGAGGVAEGAVALFAGCAGWVEGGY